MARTFLLSDLVARCKRVTDGEYDDHVETADWKAHISTAYAELYDLLVESGQRFFESTQSLTTAASGSPSTSVAAAGIALLPTDFYATVRVDRQVDSTTWTRLRRAMPQEENRFGPLAGSDAAYYAVSGGNLKLYPAPPASKVYRHVYVAQPTDYSSSADATSIDVCVPAGEDFIVWHVARVVLGAEESDTRNADRNFARAEEKVRERALRRDLLSPQRRVTEDIDDDELEPGSWYDRTGRY